MEALELFVESRELQLKPVIEKKDDYPVPFAVARTQLTLKLSSYDMAPMPDVPLNGSMSSPL